MPKTDDFQILVRRCHGASSWSRVDRLLAYGNRVRDSSGGLLRLPDNRDTRVRGRLAPVTSKGSRIRRRPAVSSMAATLWRTAPLRRGIFTGMSGSGEDGV